jgi:NAD(P)-dependent dehydrogenase (short-subunit alcohol dehydrogenase family)
MNATVLAALITGAAGLIGGALAVYFTQRRHNETREDEAQRREAEARSQAEEAHRRAAVAYLKIIEETIEGMRDQLAESQIPYRLGHQFSGLLGSYKDFLQPYLGDETQHELDKLTLRIQKVVAEEVDPPLKSGREVDPKKLRELLDDMDRVVGDVRAQATLINPTGSRAD